MPGELSDPSDPDTPDAAQRRSGWPRRHALALFSAGIVGVVAAVLLWALAISDPNPSRAVARTAARGCAPPASLARGREKLRSAEARYALESSGRTIHVDLRQIAHDRRLTGALRAGNVPAALAAAKAELVRHVVQIRVLRGGRVLLDANPTSFDVAGSSLTLRAPDGRSIGRLQITLQDIIGFIKLERKVDHARVLVRGRAGRMRTSLPGAASLPLPRSGCVVVAARRYVVGSFERPSYTGEPLTIWILTPTA